jgi:hypothetical protein
MGINVASTVSLELCMFDKPVVNVGYNPPCPVNTPWSQYYHYDHYRPVVESGAVMVASHADELKTMIMESLSNPGNRREERQMLIRRMFGNVLDGKAGQRIADQIARLASIR